MKTKHKRKGNTFYGWLTISSKGQVSIPVELQRKLSIEKGDRLLVVLRKDEDGLNLIKETVVDNTFKKFSI